MLTINHAPIDGQKPIKHTELLFENFTEFCDHALAESKVKRHYRVSFDFSGTRSLEECLSIAEKGWPEGRTLFANISDSLNVKSHIYKPETFFDVTGEFGYDMGLVISGEPENVMAQRDSDSLASGNGPIVKIIVNCSLSCGIDKEIFTRRGAALVALIDALETAGKRVELNTVWSATDYACKEQWTLNIPLKTADYPLEIDRLAFCLAHPSFVRRLCFLGYGCISPLAESCMPTYNGSPVEYEQGEPDIYIGRMYYGQPEWDSLEACQAWIVERLHSFGITLDSDKH